MKTISIGHAQYFPYNAAGTVLQPGVPRGGFHDTQFASWPFSGEPFFIHFKIFLNFGGAPKNEAPPKEKRSEFRVRTDNCLGALHPTFVSCALEEMGISDYDW